MTALPARAGVVIAGAGPTGLVLAIRLRQMGVDCLVVDRLDAPLPWSRALGLHARSLEILDAMGCLEPVREVGIVQTRVQVHNQDSVILDLDLTSLQAPFPWVLSCPQTELELILAERYQSLGGRMIRGVELTGFSQDNHHVQVRLRPVAAEPGQTPPEHEIEARFLIGCDGAHSAVRKLLGVAFEGVSHPDHFLLADVDIDWDLQRDSSHAFLIPEGVLMALPMPQGWRLILNQPLERDTDFDQPDLSPFRERLEAALGQVPELGEARWISRFSVQRRLASQYRVNRVLLAGDACHIQSPLGAQGMNTGMADAFNLAWKLDLFLQGAADGTLLDSYQQERQPVARTMLHSVDFLSRASLARNRLLRAARDTLLRLVDGRPGVHRRLLRRASQLDVNYRASPVVTEGPAAQMGRQAPPRAGDRFPYLKLALPGSDVGLSIRDLLASPRHYLVIQLPVHPAPAQIVAVYALADRVPGEFGEQVSVLVVGPEADAPELGELREFNVTLAADESGQWASLSADGALWLLRPDGHLAYRGALSDADHLIGWLQDSLRPRR